MSYSMASGEGTVIFFFKDVAPDRLIVLLRVTPYSEAQTGVNGILKILMKGHKVKGREVGADPETPSGTFSDHKRHIPVSRRDEIVSRLK